jgi:type II secretory pathway predicted ATPase ExeA
MKTSPVTEARDLRCRENFMPLKLKTIINERGILLDELCAAVLQMNGNPVSKPAMNRLYLHGEWPKKTPKESIIRQTITWLKSIGVPDDEADAAFEIDSDEQARGAPRLGRPPRNPKQEQKGDDYDPFAELVEPCMLTQEARRHFKLFSDPFSHDVENAGEVFRGADYRYAAESLWEAVRNNRMFALVGESGSGKTTILDDFKDRVFRDQLPVLIVQPKVPDKERLTGGGILEAIIKDLSPDATLRASIEARSRQAHELLAERAEDGGHTVLVFEEGHDIPVRVLKLLKRFHEMKVGFRRTLSIVLVAQPELKLKLSGAGSQAREVANRLEIFDVLPIDMELNGYIAKRFESISAQADAVFAPDAYDAIRAKLTVPSRSDRSQLVSLCYPLIVNNLCNAAINEAASLGAARVDAAIIRGVKR